MAKKKMDIAFAANQLRPGEEGFVWDKRADFDPPTGVSEWDDDDEDDWSLLLLSSLLLILLLLIIVIPIYFLFQRETFKKQ